MVNGIGVSPGIAIGTALVWAPESVPVYRKSIRKNKVSAEVDRFQEAIEETRKDLLQIRDRMIEEMGINNAFIFDAHILMLDDELLVQRVLHLIQEKRDEAAWALKKTLNALSARFSASSNQYIRERASDIQDVGNRILRHLMGNQAPSDLSSLENEVILIAHDLSPSDTATMNKEKVLGIATEIGGKTSHTAIMARALEIPAVVGLDNLLAKIQTGDAVIVDGLEGTVQVNPTPALFQDYLDRAQRYHYFERQLLLIKDLPPETTDGYHIELAANVELIEEVDSLPDYGANSVGLYRTEFLYLNRGHAPSEEEHFEAYKRVGESLGEAPGVIRTFDLGGDKFISNLNLERTFHSSLGLRAIRFCLQHPELFRTQLRGILRASAHGNLKIMFPLISNLQEFRLAKEHVEVVMEDLSNEGVPFDEEIEIGVMIEVPSAGIIADRLAREADFFSMGTNDLIQYAMAIDRVNEGVAYLYEPLHPAILRMAKYVVEMGHREGIWVGLCGEMAADPAIALLLIGLGFDELSMNPVAIPRVKKVVRAFGFEEATDIAETAMSLFEPAEIRKYLYTKLAEKFPEDVYQFGSGVGTPAGISEA